MTDTKTGFIVTYYKSCPDSEFFLNELIDVISRENYYLILASHSIVPENIQKKCDFYFYQELNVVDDRKYSHGVAENNLIELSLLHLRYKKIDKTFKVSYDVKINDVSIFDSWVIPEYKFVTCNWGDYKICTNSFYGDVGWLLEKIEFYRSVDDMFAKSNIIEACWQMSIEKSNSMNEVYSFKNKNDFFGDNNKIDNLFYNYNEIDFWFNVDELKFYVVNNGSDFKGELRIFDYYSNVCIYADKNFNLPKGIVMWISPGLNENLIKCKNGFYLEIYKSDFIIRKNFGVKDFESKDFNHKKFKLLKNNDVKLPEYMDFEEFDMYKECGLDLDSVKNYVDIGACYGFASAPFITRKIKTYIIDGDIGNVELLNKMYDKNKKIKIIGKAISNVDGTVDFFMENRGHSNVSSLFEIDATGNSEHREKVTVPSITPNTLIEKYIDEDFIDLMKVDIEGGEYIFFRTITDENIKKINKFVIEFHNNDNFEVLEIIEKLSKNNFKYKLFNWGWFTDPYIVGNKMGIIYAYR